MNDANGWPWDPCDDGSFYDYSDDATGALEQALFHVAQRFRGRSSGSEPDLRDPQPLIDWVVETVAAALTLRSHRPLGEIDSEYWRLVGETPLTPKDHEETISAMREAIRRHPDLEPLEAMLESFAYLDRRHEPYTRMQEGMTIELARTAIDHLGTASERVLQVRHLTLTVPLSQRLATLLARVGRLYVLGLEVEVAVLARAVLETALRERFMTDGSVPADAALFDLICLAHERRLLTSEGRDSAHKIRMRGNAELHSNADTLGPLGGSLGVVARLTFCLRELDLARQ